MKSAESDIKLTIVIAVFNGAETLQQCIDSVSNQTFQRKELIIIDGGSTDGTIDVIKNNESKIAYWESKPDRGIYHAWNKALRHAKGRWLYFLGSDDYLWSNQVLETIAKYLESSSVNIVYGQVNVIDRSGKIVGTYGEPWEKVSKSFQEVMSLPHQGVFHNMKLFKIYGNFDEKFKICGDYDLLLRDLNNHSALFIDNLIVAGMRHGGVSSNAVYTLQALSEIGQICKKNGVSGLRLKWRWTYSKAYIRYLINKTLGESITKKIVNSYRLVTNRTPIN